MQRSTQCTGAVGGLPIDGAGTGCQRESGGYWRRSPRARRSLGGFKKQVQSEQAHGSGPAGWIVRFNSAAARCSSRCSPASRGMLARVTMWKLLQTFGFEGCEPRGRAGGCVTIGPRSGPAQEDAADARRRPSPATSRTSVCRLGTRSPQVAGDCGARPWGSLGGRAAGGNATGRCWVWFSLDARPQWRRQCTG